MLKLLIGWLLHSLHQGEEAELEPLVKIWIFLMDILSMSTKGL